MIIVSQTKGETLVRQSRFVVGTIGRIVTVAIENSTMKNCKTKIKECESVSDNQENL
jgi:hypothetical protein